MTLERTLEPLIARYIGTVSSENVCYDCTLTQSPNSIIEELRSCQIIGIASCDGHYTCTDKRFILLTQLVSRRFQFYNLITSYELICIKCQSLDNLNKQRFVYTFVYT